MAKRCEICGKGPVVGPQRQPRAQRDARAGSSRTCRRCARWSTAASSGSASARAASARTRSSRPPSMAMRAGGLHRPAPRRPSARTRRPSAPGSSCSCRARSRSIRRPGELVEGDIAAQTRRVFENIGACSRPAAPRFDHVVRTTVFLADMNDFAAMNEVYATYFSSPAPARATVQVARLPRDARVEIDVIAIASTERGSRSLEPTPCQSVSATAPPAPRPARPSTLLQRLDHLLEVLHVADLDRHVDARRAGRRRCALPCCVMLVLMSAIFALTSASMPLRSSTCIVSRTV